MSDDKASDDTVRPFVGLTRYSDSDDAIPTDAFGHGSSMRWWASERGRESGEGIDLPDRSLSTLIDTLPRAATTEAAWKHPLTGDWVETTKHNAVVDPERVEKFGRLPEQFQFSTREQAEDGLTDADSDVLWAAYNAATGGPTDEDFDPSLSDVLDVLPTGDGSIWNIPTGDYTIINPSDFLRPLAEVVRDEGLGDDVFGEARLFRAGGKVSMDVFFDGKHVQHPEMDEDRKPIALGLQVDWDHFGGTSIHAQGMGMDWECVNAIRAITEKQTVKHAGRVDERVDWHEVWRNLLEQIDLKADQLAQIIAEAEEQILDLSELPDDFARDYDSQLEALFAYAGLPNYLARHAANNVRSEAEDPFNPSWWDIHRGATYAISHHSRSDTHSASNIEAQNRIANDMLINPGQVEENVVVAYEEDREDETLEDEAGGRAAIVKATGDLAEKKSEYEERQEAIERLAA